MPDPSDLSVGLCAIAKDEGQYLEEWIAYHHLMGFAPIRIYAHECTDNSHAVLTRMAKAGLCEWVPFTCPPRRKPQWVAYTDGLERLLDRTDWVAFVDLDEFVVTPRHASIQAFLGEYGHLDAIAVNWKMFGSSGHRTRTAGLVMERFTRCARRDFRGNRTIKTLARTELIEIPRVHTCHFAPGTVYQTVGGEVIGEQAGQSEEVTHEAIRVNHYFTRSWEEWERKAERGRGAKVLKSERKHRTPEEFAANDRNEEEDTTVLRWAQPVKELIAEINAGDIDAVYAELDAARRHARRYEVESARLSEALARARGQVASAHAALLAETERADDLRARLDSAAALVTRIRASSTWRVGARVVRVGRMLTLRRTEGDSALDVASRQLGVREPGSDDASRTSVRSLTTQTNASAR